MISRKALANKGGAKGVGNKGADSSLRKNPPKENKHSVFGAAKKIQNRKEMNQAALKQIDKNS